MSAIVSAILAMIAWPLSFETEADLQQLRPSGLKVFERVQQRATDGQWALRVVFPGSDRDTWPGFWLDLSQQKITQKSVLVFHVINATGSPRVLSWRVDDADGRREFGSSSVPAAKQALMQIWLGGLRYQLNLERLTGVYIYVRIPREDVELFFDNFNLEEAESFFTPVVHVPERQPPPPGRGPALIIFQRSWMEHVFEDDWPGDDEAVEELSIAAARGEYEPVTVGVAAGAKLEHVHLQIADFTGPASFGSGNVDVRLVRPLDKRWTYNDQQRRYIERLPVFLEPQGQEGTTIEAGRVAVFWLTVHVPERQRPGVYKSVVTVTATAGGKPTHHQVPLRLRVYPFDLPTPADMLWGVYYTGPSPFEEGDDLAKLERHLRDMRDHGMTSVGLCFGWDVSQTDVTARKVDFLPPFRRRYETFMELYKTLKFPGPVIQLADTPQAAVFAKQSLDDPKAAEAYAGIWEYVQGYAKAREWPEIIVQPVDEPAWQGEEEKKRNVRLLEILKRLAPHVRTEQDGPGDDYFHKVAGPLADFWNYNGAIGPPEIVEEARKNGKTILIYNCDVEWYRPEVDRYVAGWFQVAAGINGCFNWAYQSFSGDPYDDKDGATGDHMAVYPRGRGQGGGPSLAWEGFREGIDDYRYVALLKALTARAEKHRSPRARQIAAEATAELRKMLASIDYSPVIRNRASWGRYWDANGKLLISGSLKLPNGWTFEDYERARRKVADLCVRLMDAM